MTDAERARFLLSLKALATTFRTELTVDLEACYELALGDMPVSAMESATREAMRTQEFFPTPAILRRIAKAQVQTPKPLPRARQLTAPMVGASGAFSLAECLESCRQNAAKGRPAVQYWREQLRDEPPGKRRDSMLASLSNALAEVAHWENYAAYYERRVKAEGASVRPKAPAHWSEPREREPGEDDA